MNQEQFEEYSKQVLDHCWEVMFNKSKEYAEDEDRLANFKQPTTLFKTNQAMVCLMYDTKHISSMVKMAQDIDKGIMPSRELLLEKVGDYVNYGLLFYANMLEIMLKDEKKGLDNIP